MVFVDLIKIIEIYFLYELRGRYAQSGQQNSCLWANIDGKKEVMQCAL
jgi:hypothetical protein